MKKPFAVGDRVAVYSGKRYVGTIERINCPLASDKGSGYAGSIKVNCENFTHYVHPQQCRRLIPKAKRVAREWTAKRCKCGEDCCTDMVLDGPILKMNESVHVIEKLPKKERE